MKTLRQFDRLAKRIEERRRKAGMIHLELPDAELVYDDQGHVIDAVPEDDAYTHTLIEMFMVEANEAIAGLFEGLGVPVLRRTHPEPVPGSTEGLRDFVKVAGYKIPKSPTREDLQALARCDEGEPGGAGGAHGGAADLDAGGVFAGDDRSLRAGEQRLLALYEPDSSVPGPDGRTEALAEYLSHTKNGLEPPRDDKSKKRAGAAVA